jgi:hypothetical protein
MLVPRLPDVREAALAIIERVIALAKGIGDVATMLGDADL